MMIVISTEQNTLNKVSLSYIAIEGCRTAAADLQ